MKKSLLLLSLLAASACNFSAAQTARTAGRGNIQVGLEPGAFVAAGAGELAAAPAFDIAVRAGISDRVDLGGRVGSSALELQTKFQLTPDDGVVVSLAPRVAAFFFSFGGVSTRFVRVPVPVLIDVPVGESAFVFGPGVDMTYLGAGADGSSGNAVLISGVASAGYAAKLSDGFRLMPELAFGVPILGAAAASGDATASINAGGVLTSFKLNFLLGRTK